MVWWVVSQEFRHNIKSLIRCILKKCFSLYLNLKKPFMRNGVFVDAAKGFASLLCSSYVIR